MIACFACRATFLAGAVEKHGKFLSGGSIDLVDRHASPGCFGSRNQGVVAVSGDLSDASGASHQSNPYRVQLLHLKRAVLGLVVMS